MGSILSSSKCISRKSFNKIVNTALSPSSSGVKTINDDVLIYVKNDGCLKIESTINSITVNSGNACFLRKGEYFFEYMTGSKKSSDLNVELTFITYDDLFVKNFLQKHAETIANFSKGSSDTKVIAVFSISLLIQQTINALCVLVENNLPNTLFELKLEELLLLIVYSDSGSELCKILRCKTTRSSERLHAFMENNFLKDWKLSEFSKEFGASLTTFKELFHDVYGVSPRAWITERRLLYAYNLLLSSETRIVDIAMESGFSSQSYFTQSYRRRFGVTPSKVRSELGMTTS